MRITRHVDSVDLIIDSGALSRRQSIVYRHHAHTGLLEELNVRFGYICSILVLAVSSQKVAAHWFSQHSNYWPFTRINRCMCVLLRPLIPTLGSLAKTAG